ncbi:TolC family protein [Adhaeribacter radiodurans]|uniref:TolC family protein n=1 Tax=Adhaeribacter radiodurans TaxID=2745197 RepID=A0A7L7L762_9BACT|nr:TolC family protein [Adhaeribacter radiodurans]QMU28189.1 TolC family protein [Adhaeribacter radiodurans]
MKPVLNNYITQRALLVFSRVFSGQPLRAFLTKINQCKLLLLLGLLITGNPIRSQADTIKVVTFAAFYDQIKANHPVVRQAALLPKQAQQELRIARGNFDPQAISYYDRKNFKNQLYYENWNSMVKVPLWFGADLKAGYERNKGVNVNPEEKTPASGLTYAGISLPIGQGWLIDQRRATLRQAQLLINAAEADKIKIINKLLLEASKDYWDWVLAYQRWQLYQTAYNLSEVRYRGVSERARYGDLAAIDTVEARVDLINRQQLLQQSLTEFQNSGLIVSNYLWTPDQNPVELVSSAVPAFNESDLTLIPADTLQQLFRFAQENHPDLIKLGYKYKQLEIERRLAADKFKPKLNLEYNFLRQDFGLLVEQLNSTYFLNNYKLGVSFNYPLLLRSERGKWQLTRYKLTETDLALTQTQRDITTALQTTYNELQMLAAQIKTQETLVSQADILRRGEQTRFENGESSLFLVNTREMNVINQNVKFWELKTKYVKSIAFLYWSAGNMDHLE